MKFCPVCSEENPNRARFCLACGTELPVEGEERFRKVITLLFSDVVGSTTLGERLDPEALSNVMTQYYETMKPIIERHGGTVAKFIGDAIMAVFGIPVLHEDDALRACRAALEMQHQLAELNVELERRWGVKLATRTGLNTGEVSGVGVARAQNFVAGDAANTAARFQQNAHEGQILFGDSTYRLVRDGVRVEQVEPLVMKGKAEPVNAYLLVDVSAEADTLARRHHAPIVGREAELDLLEGTFRQVASDRACALVALLGDAGVGKSRLVEEFAHRVSDDALVVRGRCLSYGEGITFLPLLEVVRELGGIDEDDSPEAAREKLRRIAGPEADDAVDRVAAAVGLSAEQFPVQEIFWGTRKLLENVAQERPLVVVFDDVHWAEPTLLDLIEHLLDAVADTPLLLVCPARHEVVERRANWGERGNVTAVHLRPLSETEVERVIANMLGHLELAPDACARIVAATEGNPLFVEQMVAMMLDEGLLRQVGDRLEAATNLAQLSVPPSINALVAARVDRLPREERAVIGPAAVVGLTFPEAAIKELVEDALAAAVPEHLATLTQKQLVGPDELDTSHDGNAYRFNHVLIRDNAYDGVLKEARAGLHERVADWSERFYRERGRETEFEEILGYHLEQAHRFRAELGPLDDHGRELGLRAAHSLGSAGHRAFQRGDMQAAANLLERAAALIPAADRRRLELLPVLAEALTSIGEFARALAALDEAVAGARTLGDAPLAAEGSIVRFWVHGFATEAGWGREIVPQVNQAMATLEGAEHHAGLAKGWRLLGGVHGKACRYGEAAEAVQQAIVHARLAGDRREELRNTSAYAQALLFGPTPVSEGIDECERILDRAGGDRAARAFVLAVLALLQAMRGDFGEARASYVAARALYEDLGNAILAAWVSLQSGPAELLSGDLGAAERELRRAYEVLDRLGEKYFLCSVAGLLGQVLYEQARYDEARGLAEYAREITTEDDVESQALWRSLLAKALAREGLVEEPQALAHEAVAFARQTDSPGIQADALLDLAEVLRLTNRGAESVALEAAALYESKGNVVAARAAGSLLTAADRSSA